MPISKMLIITPAILVIFGFFTPKVVAQGSSTGGARDAKSRQQQTKDDGVSDDAQEEKLDYRFLQSNELLVDTAYTQEEDEVQHTFTSTYTRGGRWTSVFSQEWPVFNEKHQVTFVLPATFLSKSADGFRGVGDVEVEYSYSLIGNNKTNVTVSPGIGFSMPTGNTEKGFGNGGAGVSAEVPVSIMLNKRVAINSVFEVGYVSSAKNDEGERFRLLDLEVGQSLVWFARPRFNVLCEALWERSRAKNAAGFKEIENELFVSPGIRWAHVLKGGGMYIMPGVAFPIGIGPSRGDRGVMFYLAIEHPFRRLSH